MPVWAILLHMSSLRVSLWSFCTLMRVHLPIDSEPCRRSFCTLRRVHLPIDRKPCRWYFYHLATPGVQHGRFSQSIAG